MNLLIATQSNVNKGEFSLDLLAPINKEAKKRVAYDLIVKDDNKFTINKKFLTESLGWNTAFDVDSGKAYLLQILEEGVEPIFLKKGKDTANIFTSDALKTTIKEAGIDTSKPLFLNKVDQENKTFILFEISNTEATVENIIVDPVEETTVTPEPQAEVDQFAHQGVEEVYNEFATIQAAHNSIA